MSKSHGSRPFDGQLRNQRIKAVYLILMMGASVEAGRITSEANVASWHKADLRHAKIVGRSTAALQTLRPGARTAGRSTTGMNGPQETFTGSVHAAMQLSYCCHWCTSQHSCGFAVGQRTKPIPSPARS